MIRLKRLAKLFAALDRDDMEAGVDMPPAELDAWDGDTDLEDSEAGDTNVDDRGRPLYDYGPGNEDNSRGDISWPEWHTRGRHKVVDRGA